MAWLGLDLSNSGYGLTHPQNRGMASDCLAGIAGVAPSQKCNAQAIEDTVRHCWYAPLTPGGFHVVLAHEADQMTNAAQLALLSKLDSTDPAPNTTRIRCLLTRLRPC